MANVMLMKGGPYRFNLNSLAKQEVYQQEVNAPSCRIAAEYMHGFFTIGNSFNPAHAVGQMEALKKAKVQVDDVVGLFFVPAEHTIVDAAIKVVPQQMHLGFTLPNNNDGLVFSVVAQTYDVNDLSQPKGELDLGGVLDDIPANTATFKRTAIKADEHGYTVQQGEFVVFALKVAALPSNKEVTLADVTCRVELTAHAYDYEAPLHI